ALHTPSSQRLFNLSPSSPLSPPSVLFFFNATAPTEIYPLSLHDALPISLRQAKRAPGTICAMRCTVVRRASASPSEPSAWRRLRSEEHTSELQSLTNLVCRLLLEKKKQKTIIL